MMVKLHGLQVVYLLVSQKRYKGGKEVVKNTTTIKHETFRVYYKGDDELFVAILPVCALNNDGVVFRK